jgi:hypothetical protein
LRVHGTPPSQIRLWVMMGVGTRMNLWALITYTQSSTSR